MHWWRSRTGRTFWQANLDALGRGVTVERTFVYEHLTPPVVGLMREHHEAGVRVVRRRDRRPAPDLLIDLCVFDEERVHEVVFSSGGNAMAYRYSHDRERAALLVGKLDRLGGLAPRSPNCPCPKRGARTLLSRTTDAPAGRRSLCGRRTRPS